MTTILFSPAGPMILYGYGILRISDLNPETELRWSLTRWEMTRIGIRMVWAALTPRRRQRNDTG